ncbi:MAG TPA: PEGA domain-containing protein [Polyangiaceae bacterium]|nr:PEGA domain-containing protein [Polyangiaceae bacterium]
MLSPAVAAAQVADPTKVEARERFDRGLTLFNQGDNDGALAEFERAFSLTHHPLVLYNICLVHIAAGEPVQAVTRLEELLAMPTGLSDDKRAQAQRALNEQLERIGSLRIATNVRGAHVEIDGVDAGPVDEPEPGQQPQRVLRLPGGRHLVGLVAPGYRPERLTITLAGREDKAQLIALEPLAAALGKLHLSVTPIDTRVTLDGQEIGHTPGVVELTATPGDHELRLERPGYAPTVRKVHVAEGSTLDVQANLTIDATQPANFGQLAVLPSEEDVSVTIDGAPVYGSLASLRLPVGEHTLAIERAGFVRSERTVSVDSQRTRQVEITLAPTPEYRADWVESARSQRFWGWTATIGGAVLTGAGAGYLIWNQSEIDSATAERDNALAALEDCTNSGTCNEEEDVARIWVDDVADKTNRQAWGWVMGGVGVVGLGTGIFLLSTAPDGHRYDPKAESDVFGSLRLTPRGYSGGTGFELSGRF